MKQQDDVGPRVGLQIIDEVVVGDVAAAEFDYMYILTS